MKPIYAIAFLLGVCLVHKVSILLQFWVMVISLLTCLFLFYSVNKFKTYKLINTLLFIIIGFCWAAIYLHKLLTWQLPQDFENKQAIVEGRVASIPEIQDNHIKFLLKIKQLCIHKKCINKPPALAQLQWYGNYSKLSVGEDWRLKVKLRRSHGNANPGVFNKESYLLQNHIRAVGVVNKSLDNRLLADKFWSMPVAKFRQLILEKIEKALAGNVYLGLIEALTLGIKQHITVQQWQLLGATGTSHLMAISGLHIGLVAGAIYALANLFWKRLGGWTRASLLMPSQKVAAICSLLAGLTYSLLAGFSVSTQRSLIMLVVLLSLIIAKRTTSIWQGLSLALFIVLLYDPLTVLSSGFWLSFGAVGLILYGASGRYRAKSLWWRYGRVQWVVTLGLLPLSLLFFQQAALTSFATNLIAIPWVSFIVVPLALLGVLLISIFPWLGTWLLKFSALALQVIFKLLAWFADIKFMLWHQAITNFATLMLVAVGILLLLLPRGFPGRWLGLLWLLPLFFTKNPTPKISELWFSVVDVGQGLAIVIRTANHTLVYDTGPKYGAVYNAGDYIIIPYLRANGINTIDTLVVSHGDSDHSGGANALLKQLAVGQVITSVPERYNQFPVQACQSGMSWQWDNVQFEFLAPPLKSQLKNNNRSCVLRITIGKNHILLPGDIEKAGEDYLIKHQKNKLNATILVAPHHGSNTSSTAKFIAAVEPHYVIFSTGYLNRFGFPNKAIVARYMAYGAKSYNTAYCGMVGFKISSDGIDSSEVCYRKFSKSYLSSWTG